MVGSILLIAVALICLAGIVAGVKTGRKGIWVTGLLVGIFAVAGMVVVMAAIQGNWMG